MILETERLTLAPVSNDELRQQIDKETDAEMKLAYGEMLEGCLQHPESRIWYAMWMIRTKDGTPVGDLCFKGLGEDGTVEVGYGMLPLFEGKGYCTEAVTAATRWAAAQPGVKRVEAETEPNNAASQRVLAKAGYAANGVMGAEGPRFVWTGTPEKAEPTSD